MTQPDKFKTEELLESETADKADAQDLSQTALRIRGSNTDGSVEHEKGQHENAPQVPMENWLEDDRTEFENDLKKKLSAVENSSAARAAFLGKVSTGAIGKSKNLTGRFQAATNKERITLLAIVAFSAWLIPFAWQQASTIVIGITSILSLFLVMAGNILVNTIGLSLLFYPIAIILLLSSLLAWLNRFSQANYSEVHKDGIYMKYRSHVSRKLIWTELSSVFLFRPHGTMLPEKWEVGFGTSMARPVTVQLSAVADISEQLVEMLKENCPWASIDPDLLELWEPAIADSHTELWMKSLSSAPKENQLLPLFPGDKLKDDRYVILHRLGVGGQGTAYLVRDQLEEREVVLKETLFPVFVDKEVKLKARERFEVEVSLLCRLDNEGVVRMRDSFTDEHRGYLVLDYIEGDSLRKLVKEKGPLSESEVLGLAQQMSSVLKYLHELAPPVVHRDFTPENLILDKNGKLVLIDFNVARTMESNKTATVVGKHAYIPPEQFRGDADPRSDIYAFGATLHFLLTGEDPEPISQSHPKEQVQNLSTKLDELVADATHLDLEKRTQSADTILERLKELSD